MRKESSPLDWDREMETALAELGYRAQQNSTDALKYLLLSKYGRLLYTVLRVQPQSVANASEEAIRDTLVFLRTYLQEDTRSPR